MAATCRHLSPSLSLKFCTLSLKLFFSFPNQASPFPALRQLSPVTTQSRITTTKNTPLMINKSTTLLQSSGYKAQNHRYLELHWKTGKSLRRYPRLLTSTHLPCCSEDVRRMPPTVRQRVRLLRLALSLYPPGHSERPKNIPLQIRHSTILIQRWPLCLRVVRAAHYRLLSSGLDVRLEPIFSYFLHPTLISILYYNNIYVIIC